MVEAVKNDMLTPEDAVRGNVRCICLALDAEMVRDLQRLKEVLGFPIGAIVSEALRPFVDTFLPIADSYEQGKLSTACVPEVMKGLESFMTRADISKARLDRKVKNFEKENKVKGDDSNERKDKSSA